MLSGPLVTVITPTFNRADFLEIAVQSVLQQTCPDFEFIIVDDGSTDDTHQRLGKYLSDPRIQYYWQENQGQSVARNLALSKSSGNFICFLDSDNVWLTDKLEKSLAAFDHYKDVDIVYGDCITIDEHGNEISRKNMKRYSGRILPYMLRDNCVSMNTAMAKRRCFIEHGGLSGRRRVADDYDLWLRFSAYYKFLYLPEYLAYYRVMTKQISSDKDRRFQSNEEILCDFLSEHGHVVTPTEARNGWVYFYTRPGRYLSSQGRKLEALKCFLQAFLKKPASTVPLRAILSMLVKPIISGNPLWSRKSRI